MATSSTAFAAASKSAKIPREELANPSLPIEIITDIFSRIPAKFVFRMECLSKHYSSSLSKDPQFVEAHFRHSFRFRLSLVVKRPHGFCLIRTDGDKITEEKVTLPPLIDDPYRYRLVSIAASCDGILLLLLDGRGTLWYPATDTLFHLLHLASPYNVPKGYSLDRRNTFWGFGYCIRCRDYKVVRTVYYKHKGKKKFSPQVVCVSTDSEWRSVDLISGLETCSGSGISMNGVVYWKPIKHEGKYRILTFVMAEEKFTWISCPEFQARNMEKLWFLKHHPPLVPSDIFKLHAFLGY